MKKATKQQGFTLIELMIVVAVIGVLSAIAVPTYQNYVAKSETATAIASLTALKTQIETYTLENGSFPETASAGIPTSLSGAVTTNSLANGAGKLNYTFASAASPTIKNKLVYLERDGNGSWTCKSSIAESLLPNHCTNVQL
ncbi:pilin [Vibrio chaetopteri]|jgi:type IV pilus assembly protein PilA|uniref:pilin n=1 Tax=Vibrio chaetopteri TaxID=3016528 RepID=UPI003AB4D951